MRSKFVFTLTVLLLSVFLLNTVSAYSITTDFVSGVDGLGNYTRHGDVYLHDETVKIYIEVHNVNYDGFSNVDFVVIIKDPLNNFVAMNRMDLRNRDYEEDVYIVYSKDIPDYWLDGKYKVEVYAYDRTDPERIKELEEMAREDPEELIESGSFDTLKKFFETGSGTDIVKPFSDSKSSSRKISFTLMSQEDMKPEDEESIIASAVGPNFIIKRIDTDKFKVSPNETLTVSVEAENLGLKGSKKVEILINGESEASKTITLSPLESRLVKFDVVRDEPGTYKITIPGEDDLMKLFFVIESDDDDELSGEVTSQSSNLTGITSDDGGSSSANILSVIIMSVALAIISMASFWYYRRGKEGKNFIYIPNEVGENIDKNQIQSYQGWFKDMIED
ncbi:MAG: hypothetical protein SVY15_03935 [Halobacteriota archaeon]|nr:hypothetical protein [Halobacteriota archaeon]